MPSRFSSEGTRDDAREVSVNLGVDFREMPIEGVVGAFHEALEAYVAAAENLQGADPRHGADGALGTCTAGSCWPPANGSLVAKATIYGDMVGGYAP